MMKMSYSEYKCWNCFYRFGVQSIFCVNVQITGTGQSYEPAMADLLTNLLQDQKVFVLLLLNYFDEFQIINHTFFFKIYIVIFMWRTRSRLQIPYMISDLLLLVGRASKEHCLQINWQKTSVLVVSFWRHQNMFSSSV